MKRGERKVRLRVKELAEQRKLSDLELAGRSGVDVRVVRRMFENQQIATMTLSQIARVAEVLNVPTGTLIEDVPAPLC